MTIINPKWGERTMEVEGWNRQREFAFISILAPAKAKGDVTLRRMNEMWVWIKHVEQVTKIPASMMHSSWMGSDFTYEDIVKADSVVKDYTHQIVNQKKEGDFTHYVIEGIPKPDAPVVWGKVIIELKVDDQGVLPVGEQDYSERGEHMRTIRFSDVKV